MLSQYSILQILSMITIISLAIVITKLKRETFVVSADNGGGTSPSNAAQCSIEYNNFIVSIFYKSKFICTGTLISFNWVMTAGSCCPKNQKPEDYDCFMGSFDMGRGLKSVVLETNLHPKFDGTSNSICLIKVSECKTAVIRHNIKCVFLVEATNGPD